MFYLCLLLELQQLHKRCETTLTRICVDEIAGLMDDILTINKLAPCFRKDGCQLVFASLTAMKGGLTDGNYRETARVGVKRVKLDGTDAVPGGNYKPLTYKQFMKVFKRMQSEADVALQAQMALRGWVEPDRAAAQRVLLDDGTILSIEDARKTGCLTARGRPDGPEAGPEGDAAAAGPPPRLSHPSTNMAKGGKRRSRRNDASTVEEGSDDEGGVAGSEGQATAAMMPGEAEEAARAILARIVDAVGKAVGEGEGEEGGEGEGQTAAVAEAEAAVAEEVVKMSVSAEGQIEVAARAGGEASEGGAGDEGGHRWLEEESADELDRVVGGGEAVEGGIASRRRYSETMCHEHGNFPVDAGDMCSEDGESDSPSPQERSRQSSGAAAAESGTEEEKGGEGEGETGEEETPKNPSCPVKLALAEARLIKVQRPEYECMICLQMTSSGISLPCLHGPFCEGCLSVW